MVVLPSLTLAREELQKIYATRHYEERMLFTLLLLRSPHRRILYLSSYEIDDAIIDYHLAFVPDASGARKRLQMVPLSDDGPGPLTAKLLRHPSAFAAIQKFVEDSRDAYVLPYNVTSLEHDLCERIGVPLFGPHPDLVAIGSKSEGRRLARAAGVDVFEGVEDVRSVAEVQAAIVRICQNRPRATAVVVKLNNGFSGKGNAIINLNVYRGAPDDSNTVFCASQESWASYGPKIEREGAIVEELARVPGVVSPSVQMKITAEESVDVISTHDQLLGGPDDQVFLGSRFPARTDYAAIIEGQARKVADLLASRGVVGFFGIDFVGVPFGRGHRFLMSEINLRMLGTTHTYYMMQLLTGGRYESHTGRFVAADGLKFYVATDNLVSADYKGLDPTEVQAKLRRRHLAYDGTTRTGATLHMIGALEQYGKIGVTCIANSRAEANALYAGVAATLDDLAAGRVTS
jgi:hypothetical protein